MAATPEKTLERAATKRANWKFDGSAAVYDKYPYRAWVRWAGSYYGYRANMEYSGQRVDWGRTGGFYPSASAAINAVERKIVTLDKQRKKVW